MIKNILNYIPTLRDPAATQFISCVSTADGEWYLVQLRHKFERPLSWLRDRMWHVYPIPASMMLGSFKADDQMWDLEMMKLWHDGVKE